MRLGGGEREGSGGGRRDRAAREGFAPPGSSAPPPGSSCHGSGGSASAARGAGRRDDDDGARRAPGPRGRAREREREGPREARARDRRGRHRGDAPGGDAREATPRSGPKTTTADEDATSTGETRASISIWGDRLGPSRRRGYSHLSGLCAESLSSLDDPPLGALILCYFSPNFSPNSAPAPPPPACPNPAMRRRTRASRFHDSHPPCACCRPGPRCFETACIDCASYLAPGLAPGLGPGRSDPHASGPRSGGKAIENPIRETCRSARSGGAHLDDHRPISCTRRFGARTQIATALGVDAASASELVEGAAPGPSSSRHAALHRPDPRGEPPGVPPLPHRAVRSGEAVDARGPRGTFSLVLQTSCRRGSSSEAAPGDHRCTGTRSGRRRVRPDGGDARSDDTGSCRPCRPIS